ncbi:MAG: hypothetical protein D3916_14275 [Candidatus Electrothrix sp. MAN1_4]|nr:hypothetical protein [Candidatus Electrothrix sp. MAN1_4]
MRTLLVDGHVHIHACYDEDVFLSAAEQNLRMAGKGGGEELPTLMLAEMREDNVFARWRAGQCPWPIQTTGEDCSFYLADRLLVIAGRQVVSAEGVEVLAQCIAAQYADGRPLNETLAKIQATGALVVLPWGVGKWLGRRGKLVTEAARRYPVLLGDNAGRPSFWSFPAHFRTRPVLCGTDPLALPSQQTLAGSYGFSLTAPIDLDCPAQSLCKALTKGISVTPLGRRVSLFTFLYQQLGLRIKR